MVGKAGAAAHLDEVHFCLIARHLVELLRERDAVRSVLERFGSLQAAQAAISVRAERACVCAYVRRGVPLLFLRWPWL